MFEWIEISGSGRYKDPRPVLPSSAIESYPVDRGSAANTSEPSTRVRDQMYIHTRLPDKYQVYRSGRYTVGQYRPGSQVQQPILGCALKPRPLFRGCLYLSQAGILKLFPSSNGRGWKTDEKKRKKKRKRRATTVDRSHVRRIRNPSFVTFHFSEFHGSKASR